MAKPIYPETTMSIWVHDLVPEYEGDTIDLDATDVTFAIENRAGEIVTEAVEATKIGTSFRLVLISPDTPGRYTVLVRATSGSPVGRWPKSFYVSPLTDETP